MSTKFNSISNNIIKSSHLKKNCDDYNIMKKGEYSSNQKMKESEEGVLDEGANLAKSYMESGVSAEDFKKDCMKKGYSEEFADKCMQKAFESNKK